MTTTTASLPEPWFSLVMCGVALLAASVVLVLVATVNWSLRDRRDDVKR